MEVRKKNKEDRNQGRQKLRKKERKEGGGGGREPNNKKPREVTVHAHVLKVTVTRHVIRDVDRACAMGTITFIHAMSYAKTNYDEMESKDSNSLPGT